MSLIRRRKSPTPSERALVYVRLALKALVAQRVARKAHKGYKVGKKLPLVGVVGAAGFVIAKKAKGGSAPEPAPYTPPASGSSPQTGTAPASPPEPTTESKTTEPVAVPEGDGAPAADAADGAPPIENSANIAEVVENEATTPAHPAAAGTGGAQGEGTPTDEESAEASGESTDAAPPKD